MPTTTTRGWTYPAENLNPYWATIVAFFEEQDAEVHAALAPNVGGGRLTLESGVAISTSDQTAKTTIYYTPYQGDRIALYNGTRWKIHTFTERSLALGTLTSGKNYDVFLYDNAGTLTLELSAAWTNDTTRADAVTLLNGVTVKSGATTRRWVGTFRTTATTTTEDSKVARFVFNARNRVPRECLKTITASNHNYNGASRYYNNTSASRFEVLLGEASSGAFALGVSASAAAGIYADASIEVDNSNGSGPKIGEIYHAAGADFGLSGAGTQIVGLGYHFFALVETTFSTGSAAWGANASASAIFHL